MAQLPLLGLLLVPLALYRLLVSPVLGSRCRFYPSCSSYSETVLLRYGPFKGGWLTIRRLARCHPWHPGGFDPPP